MTDWLLKAVKRLRSDRAESLEKRVSLADDVTAAKQNCPAMFARLRAQIERDVADYNEAMLVDGPGAWLKIESSPISVIVTGYREMAIITPFPCDTPLAIWVRWTEAVGPGNRGMTIKCRPGVYVVGKKLVPLDQVARLSQEIIEPLLER